MPRPRRKAKPVDFNDEETVLAEVARELDIDPDQLSIREESGLSGFGAGTVYEVTIRGGRKPGQGGKEWHVVENEDQERDLALAVVKEDLDNEPELFNKSFIESHINTDRLRRDLESDVQNMNEETLRDRSDRDFWREWEGEGFDMPEEDEDGDIPSPTDEQIEELATKQTESQLKDPMEYLEDIYGREDAVKQAIKIAGIDIDAAAEEAVDTDGPAHFLARYDGNSYTTNAGLVYWRAN
jgi:hypothetical protein